MVGITLNSPTEHGLPNRAEAGELAVIEDEIAASLLSPPRARLCAVVTSTAGQRDLFFQAAEREWMQAWATQIRATTRSHALDFKIAEDPEWSLIRWLGSQAEISVKDAQALSALQDNGVEPTAPREIRYFMYFASDNEARAAADELTNHDYRAEVRRRNDEWCVVAAHDETPSTGMIAHMRAILTEFCEDHGGDFDGWEVAV